VALIKSSPPTRLTGRAGTQKHQIAPNQNIIFFKKFWKYSYLKITKKLNRMFIERTGLPYKK
jgi:hypothetical protein